MQSPDDAFAAQMLLVKPEEGGYSNDPNDPGGETNWGITVSDARANGYTGNMQAMTWTQAVAIYKSEYWINPQLDQLCLIDDLLARKLLDAGINQGTQLVNEFLQTALTVLCNGGKSFVSPGGIDGALGPKTRASLQAFYNLRGTEARAVMMAAVVAQQVARYFSLEGENAALGEYEYGWMVRAITPITETTNGVTT